MYSLAPPTEDESESENDIVEEQNKEMRLWIFNALYNEVQIKRNMMIFREEMRERFGICVEENGEIEWKGREGRYIRKLSAMQARAGTSLTFSLANQINFFSRMFSIFCFIIMEID